MHENFLKNFRNFQFPIFNFQTKYKKSAPSTADFFFSFCIFYVFYFSFFVLLFCFALSGFHDFNFFFQINGKFFFGGDLNLSD